MSKYPKVKFGDFVEHIVREVELEADKEYPSVGVKWYGEGVHIHEIKSGGSFNASRFEIKANDIIYNDMWARNGSVAIVPSHLDGTVASSHFPTFLPDLTRVLPKYLEFYFKTRTFWDDCENASRGSTGRNQIKKSTFYAIEIPLPLLTEQHRIVAHIESLAARVNEAQR
ncbi:MAG TPA: restriction endonuclease subunit S, partial [Anaerolineales bacterium]|nr:restriction endonuclease subunit S [Anaerolineales bacterium]